MAQLGARLDGIEEVVGSNPIGSTKVPWSGPETWATECTSHMGNTTSRLYKDFACRLGRQQKHLKFNLLSAVKTAERTRQHDCHPQAAGS